MDIKNNLASLLAKPIWQMTGEEFLQLNEQCKDRNISTDSETKVQYAYGIADLAQAVGCCQSTIYALKKSGVLDSAIVSRIGKRIIFDVGKARTVADNYQKEQRAFRRPDEQ